MPPITFNSKEERLDFNLRLALGIMTHCYEVPYDFALGRAMQITEFFLESEETEPSEDRYLKEIVKRYLEKHPGYQFDTKHRVYIKPITIETTELERSFMEYHRKCLED